MAFPWFQVEIQRVREEGDIGRKDLNEPDEEPALILEGASAGKAGALAFDCEVSYASSEQGGGGTCTLTIPDIGAGNVTRIARDAILRVKAGYLDEDSINSEGEVVGFNRRARPRYIFTGFVSSFRPQFSAGRAVWQINAVAAPRTALALITNVTRPKGRRLTFKEAFQLVARNGGFSLNLPPSFDEYHVSDDWTPEGVFISAVDDLLQEFRNAFEDENGFRPSITYNYSPSQPYQINIHHNRDEDEIEYIQYNVTGRHVFQAGPSTFFEAKSDDEEQAAINEEGGGDFQDGVQTSVEELKKEFTMACVFDPRISQGTTIRAVGRDRVDNTPFNFIYEVTHVKHKMSSHSVSNWRTESGGPLIEGGVILQ